MTSIHQVGHAISAKALGRSLKAALKKIAHRSVERLVVMKRGEPVAVILNVEAYEELLDQLEDLQLEVLAGERALSLNRGQLISLEEMRARVAKAP